MIRTFFLLLLIFSGSTVAFCQHVQVSGTVSDAATGETLAGATIIIEENGTKTIADVEGNFSLKLTPGKYTIRISLISYDTLTLKNIEIEQCPSVAIEAKLGQINSIPDKAAEAVIQKRLVSQLNGFYEG